MIITIDVHEKRHTCPASIESHWIDEQAPTAANQDHFGQGSALVQIWHSHVIDRQTTIVATQDDGPCRTPVRVRVGDHQAQVACARIRPPDQQCVACRVLLIVRHVTYTDLGHHTSQPQLSEAIA